MLETNEILPWMQNLTDSEKSMKWVLRGCRMVKSGWSIFEYTPKLIYVLTYTFLSSSLWATILHSEWCLNMHLKSYNHIIAPVGKDLKDYQAQPKPDCNTLTTHH